MVMEVQLQLFRANLPFFLNALKSAVGSCWTCRLTDEVCAWDAGVPAQLSRTGNPSTSASCYFCGMQGQYNPGYMSEMMADQGKLTQM